MNVFRAVICNDFFNVHERRINYDWHINRFNWKILTHFCFEFFFFFGDNSFGRCVFMFIILLSSQEFIY